LTRRRRSITWPAVTADHVREACRQFDAGLVTSAHPARNTFLILDGKRYPAKFIRGVAYELATGRKLNPNTDFSGGTDTARFFQSLGFQIEYRADTASGQRKSQRDNHSHRLARTRGANPTPKLDEKQQKEVLRELLARAFGPVKLNHAFEWLVVPAEESMDQTLLSIYRRLAAYRGFRQFFTAGTKLLCDFYLPQEHLIIEYDERQHFTEPRAVSLEEYPADLPLGFNREQWIDVCRDVQARDNEPLYRDEQRAFYDALRDILAPRNGFKLPSPLSPRSPQRGPI